MAAIGLYDYCTAKGEKMRLILLMAIAFVSLYAGKYDKVKITPDISYVYVYHKGKAVKVHRIQDVKHKLTGEYAKTYRPGHHIQPIRLMEGLATIGEVEVVKFMKEKVNKKEGLIIDARTRDAYAKESIPSAVNIPADIRNNDQAMDKIFKSLGMEKRTDGSWNSRRAMELVIYGDGLWCEKSSEMIKNFVSRGYPTGKLFYYRGGFQMWKIPGFTTVRNE